jgi:hypothetical protein
MFAIASGACAALSGLSEYRECSDDCSDGDTNPRDGAQGAPAEASTSYGEAGGGQPVDVGDVAAFPPDSASEDEEPADAWTTNEGMDAAADAGADEATDAAIGVGTDAATDAGAATGPPPSTGATCGPLGTTVRCNADQVCCANLSAQTNSCVAPSSCSSNASLSCTTASDCPASAPICCAHVTLTGGTAPACTASAYYASCESTCSDNPPADGCIFTGIVRLCSHDSDCRSDTANPLNLGVANECWNYNSDPESFCTSAVVGESSGGVHHQ